MIQGFGFMGLLRGVLSGDSLPVVQEAISRHDKGSPLKDLDLYVLHALQKLQKFSETGDIFTNGGEVGVLVGRDARRINESFRRLEEAGLVDLGAFNYSTRYRQIALVEKGIVASSTPSNWLEAFASWGSSLASLDTAVCQRWGAIMLHTSPADFEEGHFKKVISKSDLPRLPEAWFEWSAEGVPRVRAEYRAKKATCASIPTPAIATPALAPQIQNPPPTAPVVNHSAIRPEQCQKKKKQRVPWTPAQESEIEAARSAIPDENRALWRDFLATLGESPEKVRNVISGATDYLCFLAFLAEYKPKDLQDGAVMGMRDRSIRYPISFIGRNIEWTTGEDGSKKLRVKPELAKPRRPSRRPMQPYESKIPKPAPERTEEELARGRDLLRNMMKGLKDGPSELAAKQGNSRGIGPEGPTA